MKPSPNYRSLPIRLQGRSHPATEFAPAEFTERINAGLWYALPDPVDPHLQTCEACGKTLVAVRSFGWNGPRLIFLDYRYARDGFSLVGPDATGILRTWARAHKCGV